MPNHHSKSVMFSTRADTYDQFQPIRIEWSILLYRANDL